jgi:dCMP deaminase
MSNKKKVLPRRVPSCDDYYMGLAFWVASRSKDPHTQVGAVIVSFKNEPISTGYNGLPRGISDDQIDWDRPDKYDWIIHAESNAIKYANGSLSNSTLYITAPPCNKCMLEIAAVDIRRVVYFMPKIVDEKSSLVDKLQKTLEIANMASVILEEYKGNLNWMRDRFMFMEKLGIFDCM